MSIENQLHELPLHRLVEVKIYINHLIEQKANSENGDFLLIDDAALSVRALNFLSMNKITWYSQLVYVMELPTEKKWKLFGKKTTQELERFVHKVKMNGKLKHIEETHLSTRAKNVLYKQGIHSVEELLSTNLANIHKWRNCGDATVEEIKHFVKTINKNHKHTTITATITNP